MGKARGLRLDVSTMLFALWTPKTFFISENSRKEYNVSRYNARIFDTQNLFHFLNEIRCRFLDLPVNSLLLFIFIRVVRKCNIISESIMYPVQFISHHWLYFESRFYYIKFGNPSYWFRPYSGLFQWGYRTSCKNPFCHNIVLVFVITLC